jgi:two-component system chemotaxis response regulator CheY
MAKRILIVDDSVMVRQMVSFTLRDAGFEVEEAGNGQEALDQLSVSQVDLIVTDLNMPVMDGIALIANARKLASCKFIPIIMLTTESQPEMKLKGKEAGATGWMVKPFDPPKLLGVIAKVLG